MPTTTLNVPEPIREVKRGPGNKGAEMDAIWRERVERTFEHDRTCWNGHKTWRNCNRLLRGSHWSNEINEDDVTSRSDELPETITVPRLSLKIFSFIGMLTRAKPKAVARPLRAEDVDKVDVYEDLLDYHWDELEFIRPFKLYLADLCTIGHGILRTDFNTDIDIEALENADEGERFYYDDFVRSESPCLRRVSPFLFTYSLDAPDNSLRTARYCMEIFFQPLDAILADSRYEAAAKQKLRAGDAEMLTLRDFEEMTAVSDDDMRTGLDDVAQDDLIALVEIHDKRFNQRLVYVYGSETLLMATNQPYEYLDGFPYLMTKFFEVPNERWGIGFIRLAYQVQLLHNLLRTKISQAARTWMGRYTVSGNSVDAKTLRMLNDPSSAAVPIGPGTKVEALDIPSVGQDLLIANRMVEADLDELSGQDALVSGGRLPGRTSAAEIRQRIQSFNQRLGDVVGEIERTLSAVYRQTLQHLQANMSRDKVITVTGRRDVQWRRVSAEDIRAEMSVRIEPITRPDADPAQERQQYLDLLQRVVQILPHIIQLQQQTGTSLAPDAVPDLGGLLKLVIEKFDSAELDEAVSPQQEPPDGDAAQGLERNRVDDLANGSLGGGFGGLGGLQ